MASKRDVKIETPGEPTPDAPAEAPEPASNALRAGEASQPAREAQSGKSSDLTAAQEVTLAADLAKTRLLVGNGQALDWSSLNHGLPAAVAKPDPDAGLPESADPKSIKAPVLTKSGWVMPEHDPRARTGPR